MRAGNREVNIFNMSLLDILCGALGAFCFMMLALFPHYGKGNGMSEGERKQLESKRYFEPLVVQVWWTTPAADVDLYLTRLTTKGAMPKPTTGSKQYPTIVGESRTDCTSGPCSEVWLLRDLPPGSDAEIFFKLMKPASVSGPVLVTGQYIHNGEVKQLLEGEVSPQKPITNIGKFAVREDGTVELRASTDSLQMMNKTLERIKRETDGGKR